MEDLVIEKLSTVYDPEVPVNGTGAFRLLGLSTVRMIKLDFGNVLTITGV